MKKRLDLLLTERGLAPSREKARAVIMAGQVYVNGQKEDKAGAAFDETVPVEVRGETLRYVSRGGLKLEKAIAVFPIVLTGRTCMDVGASTGGFTDCMLRSGAARVYSVDVGRGQLAWSLRNDPRVVCLEKTNIRYLTQSGFEDLVRAALKEAQAQVMRPSFVSIDVSFISLSLVLPPVRELMSPDGEVVALIKPQFEAGREKVGKKGVVRDPAVHEEVIEKVTGLARTLDFSVRGLTYSPVKGPEGNIEYLLWMRKKTAPALTSGAAAPGDEAAYDIKAVVEEAHRALDR